MDINAFCGWDCERIAMDINAFSGWDCERVVAMDTIARGSAPVRIHQLPLPNHIASPL